MDPQDVRGKRVTLGLRVLQVLALKALQVNQALQDSQVTQEHRAPLASMETQDVQGPMV